MKAQQRTWQRASSAKIPSIILFIAFLGNCALASDLSLASSASYQTAIQVTYSNPSMVGNTLVATVQITNTSGTWVYLEQDSTSSPNIPVTLPYTVYLIGPGGTKVLNNISFTANSFLKFNVTTPVGLDYASLDPKCRALFGALTVDFLMRGLLTTALPADAFDNMAGLVDPLLDQIVSSLGSLGTLAEDLNARDAGHVSIDLAQLAVESKGVESAVSQILSRYVSSDQVSGFFESADSWLGTLADIIDLPEKYELLKGLTLATFNAPTTSWNRLDVVVTDQSPAITSVSPLSLRGSRCRRRNSCTFTAPGSPAVQHSSLTAASHPIPLACISSASTRLTTTSELIRTRRIGRCK